MMPAARPPLEALGPPASPLPSGACDAHVHLFGGPGEFARDPARSEDPAPGDLGAWHARLRRRMGVLGLGRAVLVQSVIYREDNTMTAAALAAMGPAARGVALLRPDVSDTALDALHDAGFRGVRLDLVHPGALRSDDMPTLAPRLADRGWHVQVFGRWAEHSGEIAHLEAALPCPVVLDHFGYPDVPAGADAPSFRRLLRLLEGGRLWVKLSSLYRQGPAEALAPLLAAATRANPERILWGSNWPHVRLNGPLPDETALIDMVQDALEPGDIDRVFRANPEALYGFAPLADAPALA